MEFIRNFPFFSILLPMVSGPISSCISGKKAKLVSLGILLLDCILCAAVLVYTMQNGGHFNYRMGNYPAPFGNEIRIGLLEAFMALFFCVIMLISLLGGINHVKTDVPEEKTSLFFIMINLLLASLLALIFTNDLFTAYVFIEINTISACGLIMIRGWGRNILAAVKYMIMSLLGSGLVLISISILYGITGHLLMEDLHEAIVAIMTEQTYVEPLTVAIGLFCVGIAIKSALFPFHAWLPDAYSYSTCSSSAILSSLVSKGYIFLLLKFFYRVVGTDIIAETHITNVLFLFGIAGMIFGSLSAIQQTDAGRMIAFSSVAQIGYIYMGFGISTEAGMIASVFHILSHAASKSMLFVSATGLSEVSNGNTYYKALKGAGYRHPIAGIAFSVGSFSMVGIPLLAGFTSKVYFAEAAFTASTPKMVITLIALAISTVLNAMYFLRQVVTIYTPVPEAKLPGYRPSKVMCASLVLFIALNFVLGMCSHPIFLWIQEGLANF